MTSIMDVPPKDWTLELYNRMSVPDNFKIEFVPEIREIRIMIHEGKLKATPFWMRSHYRFSIDDGLTWIYCDFNDLPDTVKDIWVKWREKITK